MPGQQSHGNVVMEILGAELLFSYITISPDFLHVKSNHTALSCLISFDYCFKYRYTALQWNYGCSK